MKTIQKLLVLMVLSILFSCAKIPDAVNPDPNNVSYIIDKTAKSTYSEQVFRYYDEIEIVIPPMTMNGDCKIKVQKKSSTPDANIEDVKAGTGYYIIKFIGETNFNGKIKCIIKYDPTMIDPKSNAVKTVKGIIKLNSSWNIADYEIDELNKKIIIYISSLSSKNYKDTPKLLINDVEIMIGSGYSTIDTGQNDELLAKLKYFTCKLELGDFTIVKGSDNNPDKVYLFEYTGLSSSTGFETGPGAVDSVFTKFESNKFTIARNIEYNEGRISLNISGDVDSKRWDIANLTYGYSFNYKMSGQETRTDEIFIKFNPFAGKFKDYWGQFYDLVIDSKSKDNKNEDLNKIIKEISFTITYKNGEETVDIFSLKKINPNLTKNYFSLALRSMP